MSSKPRPPSGTMHTLATTPLKLMTVAAAFQLAGCARDNGTGDTKGPPPKDAHPEYTRFAASVSGATLFPWKVTP